MRREDGAAVVIALGLIAVLLMVAGVGGAVVAVLAVHRQVQGAADLAALAGASAAAAGRSPCPAVQRVAQRNAVEVRECESDGSIVVAVLERHLPAVLGDRIVQARARAGPRGDPG